MHQSLSPPLLTTTELLPVYYLENKQHLKHLKVDCLEKLLNSIPFFGNLLLQMLFFLLVVIILCIPITYFLYYLLLKILLHLY